MAKCHSKLYTVDRRICLPYAYGAALFGCTMQTDRNWGYVHARHAGSASTLMQRHTMSTGLAQAMSLSSEMSTLGCQHRSRGRMRVSLPQAASRPTSHTFCHCPKSLIHPAPSKCRHLHQMMSQRSMRSHSPSSVVPRVSESPHASCMICKPEKVSPRHAVLSHRSYLAYRCPDP